MGRRAVSGKSGRGERDARDPPTLGLAVADAIAESAKLASVLSSLAALGPVER